MHFKDVCSLNPKKFTKMRTTLKNEHRISIQPWGVPLDDIRGNHSHFLTHNSRRSENEVTAYSIIELRINSGLAFGVWSSQWNSIMSDEKTSR